MAKKWRGHPATSSRVNWLHVRSRAKEIGSRYVTPYVVAFIGCLPLVALLTWMQYRDARDTQRADQEFEKQRERDRLEAPVAEENAFRDLEVARATFRGPMQEWMDAYVARADVIKDDSRHARGRASARRDAACFHRDRARRRLLPASPYTDRMTVFLPVVTTLAPDAGFKRSQLALLPRVPNAKGVWPNLLASLFDHNTDDAARRFDLADRVKGQNAHIQDFVRDAQQALARCLNEGALAMAPDAKVDVAHLVAMVGQPFEPDGAFRAPSAFKREADAALSLALAAHDLGVKVAAYDAARDRAATIAWERGLTRPPPSLGTPYEL
jgi:hypothetical protein